jgi:hypothetical protein
MSNYDNLQPLPKPWSNYQLNGLVVNNLSVNTNESVSGNLNVTGNISSGGTISSNGQSIIYYINAPSAQQTIPDSTVTVVTLLNTIGLSQGSDLSFDPLTSILTFNTKGIYHIDISLIWSSAANGQGQFILDDTASGTSILNPSGTFTAGNTLGLTGSITKSFNAGTSVQLKVEEISGGHQYLGDGSSSQNCFISAYRVF